MEDTRLKKIIVLATVVLCLTLWWRHRPDTMTAAGTDTTFQFIHEKIDARGRNFIPLIIGLHGNGDTPRNFEKTLFNDMQGPARLVLLQGTYKYGAGYAWPMSGHEMQRQGDALADIVRRLTKKYTSPIKPVLVGFSGGACMAYYQAAVHAQLYSTIIPISGQLDTRLIRPAGESPDPAVIRAIHGRTDKIISFTAGQRAIDTFAQMGWDAELIELPGDHLCVFASGHGAFLQVLESAVE